MKKRIFIAMIALLCFGAGGFAQTSLSKEVKSDTLPVTKVYVEDSTTKVLKAVELKFLVRKVEVSSAKVEGMDLPPWGKFIGFFDDKNRKINPVLFVQSDGKVFTYQ